MQQLLERQLDLLGYLPGVLEEKREAKRAEVFIFIFFVANSNLTKMMFVQLQFGCFLFAREFDVEVQMWMVSLLQKKKPLSEQNRRRMTRGLLASPWSFVLLKPDMKPWPRTCAWRSVTLSAQKKRFVLRTLGVVVLSVSLASFHYCLTPCGTLYTATIAQGATTTKKIT